MRRRRPIDVTTAASRFSYRLGSVFALTLLLAMTSLAQQPTANKQRAPRLTTDDVARAPVVPPVETKETAASSEEAGKSGAVDPKAGQPKASDTKASPEESSWRDQVAKARDRAKALQRAAEEAELRITTLRNELGVSGQSSRYRNDTAAELEQAGQRLVTMLTQARAAADDLTQLIEYGKQKAFAEAEEAKPTEGGKPNEQYYSAQFAKLTEALEGAQRRIQLYDDRVRDLNQQMTTNSGGKDKAGHRTGGDGYFTAQLQKDRDEALQKLDEARTALAKAQTDLDALRNEARRAGVPPGVFR